MDGNSSVEPERSARSPMGRRCLHPALLAVRFQHRADPAREPQHLAVLGHLSTRPR